MKFLTTFERCCICGEKKPLTFEHVIPESIGGTLECNIQCTECNSDLGSQLVAQLKNDPAIRLAILNLKNQVPHLYKSIEDNQPYISTDITGQKVIVIKTGRKHQIKAQKRKDGSFVFDSSKDRNHIRNLLAKFGFSHEEAQKFLTNLKSESTYVLIDPTKNPIAAEWKIQSYFPPLDVPEIDDRVVVLIAFNYICMLLGNLVFENGIEFIRRYIGLGEKSDKIEIKSYSSLEYKPFHAIFSELDHNETRIAIILFGWLKYVVHFKFIVRNTPDIVFIEDLKNQRILTAISLQEAEKGNFYSNKPNF